MKLVYIGHLGHDTFHQRISVSYLTIGKIYDIYEKQGSHSTYYIIADDLNRRISSDVCSYCTIEEWRDKQLKVLLEK